MDKIDISGSTRIPDIIQTLTEEMMNDDVNESENLIEFYNKADDDERRGIDNCLLYLCGWSLESLVKIAKGRGNYVDEERYM